MDADLEREISEASLMENAHRAVSVIIRPPRTTYEEKSLTNLRYPGGDNPIPRLPISFKNRRDVKLVGSFYISGAYYTEERHCCIIYLHGNVGSQQEGRSLVGTLAPRGISVFCFDMSGSGNSGGEFVTLGFYEHEDVLDSIAFLTKQFQIHEFVLWGRSMGGACALMAAHKSPLIKGIIVDSTYRSLSQLFSAIAKQTPLPSVIRPMAVWWIKREVQSRAGFDCNEVLPSRCGKSALKVPLLLGHCEDDDFVPYSHGVRIFKKYGCKDKEMMTLTGGHNGRRDIGWIMKSVRFALRMFRMPFQYFEVDVTDDNVEHAASFAELMAKA